MESQLVRSHEHGQEQYDPHIVAQHNVSEGESDEHHHEKKSVLKKVKDKAKKITDTIKMHGHGHGHNHDHDHEGHIPDDHDPDEEEEEEDEIVQDPEVHGAPMYGSAAIRSRIPGQVEDIGHPTAKQGLATAMDEDTPGTYLTGETDRPMKSSVVGHDVNKGQPRGNLGRETMMGEKSQSEKTPESSSHDPHETKDTDPTKTFVHGQEEYSRQPKVNLQRPRGLEEDPHAPKDKSHAYDSSSNYQTKVTDPTGRGGEEAGITPVLRSLDKMNIYDESKQRPKTEAEQSLQSRGQDQQKVLPTGSHDQFSPELSPPKRNTISENPEQSEEFPETKQSQENPRHETAEKGQNQSSYTGKISASTSAIANKAISAKNVVASKLGYGEKEKDKRTEHEIEGGAEKSNSKAITTTLTEKLSPVYEKVAGAGTSVMSKIHGTSTAPGSEEQGAVKGQDKGVSVKDYFAEKLKPGDEDRALSEVISDALHTRKAESEESSKPLEKVMESEKVARRLGTGDESSGGGEGEGADSSFVNSPGKGVVDKIKGAVGSWFGKGQETRGSEALSSSAGGQVGSGMEGERRLQESGN